MGIFKKNKKANVMMAAPPEEAETPQEIEHLQSVEKTAKKQTQEPSYSSTIQEVPKEELNYKQVPVCMSQTQINNLIIENNIMLRQIIAEID